MVVLVCILNRVLRVYLIKKATVEERGNEAASLCGRVG